MDTWLFFKWVFKTFVAIMILSNTFNAVMAVFDVSQHVINNAAGLISGSTVVTPDMMATLEADLQLMDIGPTTMKGALFMNFIKLIFKVIAALAGVSPEHAQVVGNV